MCNRSTTTLPARRVLESPADGPTTEAPQVPISAPKAVSAAQRVVSRPPTVQAQVAAAASSASQSSGGLQGGAKRVLAKPAPNDPKETVLSEKARTDSTLADPSSASTGASRQITIAADVAKASSSSSGLDAEEQQLSIEEIRRLCEDSQWDSR